jgi:Zn-finger nucleic acid-binding protein
LAPASLLEGGRVQVDVCPQCRGIWFDAAELQTILEAAADEQARVDRQLIGALADRNAGPGEVRYVPCPVCATMMNRCAHGHRSGVVADRCAAHGVWLDGGELETLFDWVSAGGQVLDAQVSEERRQEEARREQARRQRLTEAGPLNADVMAMGGRHGHHRSRGWLADALADVLERIVS